MSAAPTQPLAVAISGSPRSPSRSKLLAELTLEALRKAGYSDNVEHVSDGEEALGMIFEPKNSPSLPKVILLDLNIPVMDGREFLAHKAEKPEIAAIPVIICQACRQAAVATRQPGAGRLRAGPVRAVAAAPEAPRRLAAAPQEKSSQRARGTVSPFGLGR